MADATSGAGPQAAHCPQSAEVASAAARVLGVLRIGTVRVALSIDVLREVFTCPEQLDGLPAAAQGLIGAVDVRGQVVPVLDLRVVLGMTAPRAAGQLVALLRVEGRTIGLLADELCGLSTVACEALAPMQSLAGGLLFGASFTRVEDGTVASLIDAPALLRLPGVPALCTVAGNGVVAARANAQAGDLVALMLVRCGPIRLAIEVAQIQAMLPRVQIHSAPIVSDVCRGVIEHDGRRIPAIDPLVLTGMGCSPDDASYQAVLVRFDAGLVALLVSEAHDLVRLERSALSPLGPLTSRRPDLLRASVSVPGHGDHFVLDAQGVRNDVALAAFSSLNVRIVHDGAAEASRLAAVAASRSRATHVSASPPASPDERSATTGFAAAGQGRAVVCFEVGVEYACDLGQIDEVLEVPSGWVSAPGAHAAVLGFFPHRGRTLSLVCLSSVLDGPPVAAGAEQRVLLVAHRGGVVGFLVARLNNIETTRWERTAGRTGAGRAQAPQARDLDAVVEVGDGAARRTLHLIDLRALADGLAGIPAEAGDTGACGDADVTDVSSVMSVMSVTGVTVDLSDEGDHPTGTQRMRRGSSLNALGAS